MPSLLSFKKLTAIIAIPLAFSTVTPSVFAAEDEVNIYSTRQAFLIKPMLEAFTEETGIKANIIFAKKGLIERIAHEGRNTPADVFITPDIGPLTDFINADLSQPVESEILEANIPEEFRDPDNQWFGLTTRSRIIYTSKDRVKVGDIKTYEDLADPKWKGKICTRSGKHTYNLSLIGSMIAHHGEADTEKWLRAVKENLARKPQGNDRAQVKAVKEGVCDVALGNSYYFGKMITNTEKPEQVEWANSVNLLFPNQSGRGAHMGISGIALAKYAKNRQNAVKLMEFLSESKAQYMYAQDNFEFPVLAGTPKSPLIEKYMGDFKSDKLSLDVIADNREKASKLVDKVGFDN